MQSAQLRYSGSRKTSKRWLIQNSPQALSSSGQTKRREKGEWGKGDGAGEGTSPMINAKRTEEKFKWTESTLKDELT